MSTQSNPIYILLCSFSKRRYVSKGPRLYLMVSKQFHYKARCIATIFMLGYASVAAVSPDFPICRDGLPV